MRKTWVKRENIYYKPFYKDKSKIFFLLIFFVGISFIAYQVGKRNRVFFLRVSINIHKLIIGLLAESVAQRAAAATEAQTNDAVSG